MENLDRILRPKEVAEMIGLSRAHLYNLIRAGDFPHFFALGPKARGIRLQKVQDWITDREQSALSRD